MQEQKSFAALIPELYCRDFATSLVFYTSVLGFSIEYQRPEDGFAMLERQGARIMLDMLQEQNTDTGRTWLTGVMDYPFGRGVNFQIQTGNVDVLYQHVLSAGCKIFMPIEEKWYRVNDKFLGNRQFIVLDPDGYMLRFFQDLGARV